MDRIILVKDTKGYYCSKCRQRFPNTINVELQIQCPSCERVSNSSSRPSPSSSSSPNQSGNKGNSRVSSIVENFKNRFLPHFHLRRHHHPPNNQDSDSDKSNSTKLSLSSDANSPSIKFSSRSVKGPRGPRKSALLIGISYKKLWKYRLKGTVSDVENMKNVLIDTFGFLDSNILVLTEEKETDLIPTRENIQKSLTWLVEDCRAGDSLVFYFSGHGLRQPDFNRDEHDGFDETICPVDFLEKGMILDNDINSTIVWPLPKGVTLHAIVDACHSGTILDLVYIYNREKKIWEDNSPPNGSRKHTNGGLAISISACEDNQMAADTTAFPGKGMNGALTYILIEIVRKHPGPTYGDLINLIHETIDEVNSSGCFLSRVIRSMFHSNLLQKPLLSASERFDVMKKHFIL